VDGERMGGMDSEGEREGMMRDCEEERGMGRGVDCAEEKGGWCGGEGWMVRGVDGEGGGW
jgi:hypothetical protein